MLRLLLALAVSVALGSRVPAVSGGLVSLGQGPRGSPLRRGRVPRPGHAPGIQTADVHRRDCVRFLPGLRHPATRRLCHHANLDVRGVRRCLREDALACPKCGQRDRGPADRGRDTSRGAGAESRLVPVRRRLRGRRRVRFGGNGRRWHAGMDRGLGTGMGLGVFTLFYYWRLRRDAGRSGDLDAKAQCRRR